MKRICCKLGSSSDSITLGQLKQEIFILLMTAVWKKKPCLNTFKSLFRPKYSHDSFKVNKYKSSSPGYIFLQHLTDTVNLSYSNSLQLDNLYLQVSCFSTLSEFHNNSYKIKTLSSVKISFKQDDIRPTFNSHYYTKVNDHEYDQRERKRQEGQVRVKLKRITHCINTLMSYLLNQLLVVHQFSERNHT